MAFALLDPITRKHVKAEVHLIVRVETVHRFVNFVNQEPFPHLWPYDVGDRQGIEDTIYLYLYQRKTAIGKNELAARASTWYKGRANSLKHNLKVIGKEMFGLVLHIIQPGSLEEWSEHSREIKYQGKKVTIHLKADSADFRLRGISSFLRLKLPSFQCKSYYFRLLLF